LEQLAILGIEQDGQLLNWRQTAGQSGVCQYTCQYGQHQYCTECKAEPKSDPLGALLGAAANLAATVPPLADDGKR
jgi:hypothetical protein